MDRVRERRGQSHCLSVIKLERCITYKHIHSFTAAAIVAIPPELASTTLPTRATRLPANLAIEVPFTRGYTPNCECHVYM